MKRIVLIMFTGIFTSLPFQSCNKQSKQNEVPGSIVGRWELRTTSAAMMPTPTNYPAGNGNILKFTGTAYEKYINGQPVKTGIYTIIGDTTVDESVCLDIPADQFTLRIIYDNDHTQPQGIHTCLK